MAQQKYGPISLDRMEQAYMNVRQRLIRATTALEKAGIPYGVAGGNAVAAWVSRVDPGAVRATQDVDLLIRREDFTAASAALVAAGFVATRVMDDDVFLDGETGGPRDAVHIVYASEKVKPHYPAPTADISETEQDDPFRVLTLPALVRMKLTSYRRKDQVHLLDLLEVGLIDASWVEQLPTELGSRLQELIDTPDD